MEEFDEFLSSDIIELALNYYSKDVLYKRDIAYIKKNINFLKNFDLKEASDIFNIGNIGEDIAKIVSTFSINGNYYNEFKSETKKCTLDLIYFFESSSNWLENPDDFYLEENFIWDASNHEEKINWIKWSILRDVRDQICETIFENSLQKFFRFSYQRLLLFFNTSTNSWKIDNEDCFIEIERGLLFLLENLKILSYSYSMTFEKLHHAQNVLEMDFHKNYESTIYIYSFFDKISSLVLMFENEEFYSKKNDIYFQTLLEKENKDFFCKNYLEHGRNFLESTEKFYNSKLFGDFKKKVRNSIVHEHTMPMDSYFTNIYVYVGFTLLVHYIVNILMPFYENE